MRIIIAGTRTVTDMREVERAMAGALADWGLQTSAITEIVSGGARGVDRFGEAWAARHGIPSRVFEARWSEHGKAAGPIRNGQMAERADGLVAVWDGESAGTRDMIQRALTRGLRVYVHTPGAAR